ncbi:MAG: hypothetical protein QOG31_1075 [Thermoplasmata archaeon]|jgi:hypothetical protein|nr:hypothetical protein [Thermoplasmata archaeon]
MGNGGKPFTPANGLCAMPAMTARGLLRIALPLLALCALATPAQADGTCVQGHCANLSPCVGIGQACMVKLGTCTLGACVVADLPHSRGCTPLEFTGRGPLGVDVDASCVGDSLPHIPVPFP